MSVTIELRARLVQLLREIVADVAAALDRDRAFARESSEPQRSFADAWIARNTPCAVTGDGSPDRPARPRDVVGLHVDEVHVRRARADVFGRDVAAAEALDEAAVRAEDHLAIGRLVVADDDRLAAAEVQAGHGVLVGHAAREAQRVDDRLLVGGVIPEARAAERGAERRCCEWR